MMLVFSAAIGPLVEADAWSQEEITGHVMSLANARNLGDHKNFVSCQNVKFHRVKDIHEVLFTTTQK